MWVDERIFSKGDLSKGVHGDEYSEYMVNSWTLCTFQLMKPRWKKVLFTFANEL